MTTNGELVAFYEQKGTFIGVGSLSSGVATLALPPLSAGAYQFAASFGPDSYFAVGTASLPVNVEDKTTLSLSASPTSIVQGQSVTLTATLSGSYGASANGETITFAVNNSKVIGTGTIASGVASITVSTLSPGANTIAAAYVGDTDNTGAISGSVVVNVTPIVVQATPAIALTSSANPAFVSNSVTFTAALTSSSGTPTGTVSFYNGTSLMGQQTLSSGTASLLISTLATGTNSITAVYSGDANFLQVTSSAIAESVVSFSIGAPAGGSTTASTSPGGQAVYSLLLSPPNGGTFPAAISFSVTGLPAGAQATFSPSSISAGAGATTVTLTVQVPGNAASLLQLHPFRESVPPVSLGLVLLPAMTLFRKKWRGRRRFLWLVLLAVTGIAGTATVSGCGGGSSTVNNSSPQNYSLTVLATSGSLTNSTTLKLTVE